MSDDFCERFDREEKKDSQEEKKDSQGANESNENREGEQNEVMNESPVGLDEEKTKDQEREKTIYQDSGSAEVNEDNVQVAREKDEDDVDDAVETNDDDEVDANDADNQEDADDEEDEPDAEPKSKKSRHDAEASADPSIPANDAAPPLKSRTRLPAARVKAIIKLDPEVTLASQEAVMTVSKAAELFVASLAKQAAGVTALNKKKTIQRRDLDAVVDADPALAFLEGMLDF